MAGQTEEALRRRLAPAVATCYATPAERCALVANWLLSWSSEPRCISKYLIRNIVPVAQQDRATVS
jgi:hypothetical protein